MGPDKHQQCHHNSIGATGTRPIPLLPPQQQWCLVGVLLPVLRLADFTILMRSIPLVGILTVPTCLHPLDPTPPTTPQCSKHPHHIERAPRPGITMKVFKMFYSVFSIHIILYLVSYHYFHFGNAITIYKLIEYYLNLFDILEHIKHYCSRSFCKSFGHGFRNHAYLIN